MRSWSRLSPAIWSVATVAALAASTFSAHAGRAPTDGAVRSGQAAEAAAPANAGAADPADADVITGGSVGIPWTPQWSSKTAGTTTADGDTWYNTWADDGNIYATSDDSVGFKSNCYNNFVVNELTGNDPSQLDSPFTNCMTGYGSEGNGGTYRDGATWKTDGVISVDGTLYVVVARQVDGYGGYPNGYQSSTDASIIKSTDHGRTWTNPFGTNNDPNGAPPPPNPSGPGAKAMFPGKSFGTPVFINYGQDDNPASTADGGDQYVYAISNDGWAYDGSYAILGRVPRSKIGDLNAADWQFYTGPSGGDGSNPADWSADSTKATHLISATHQLSQSGVQYVPGLHEYILTSFYYPFNSLWSTHGQSAYTTWSFYQAPHPWGPWTQFYNAPTVQCYMSCDPASASPIGLYDPVMASKFINMDGLSDVIFSSGDWNYRSRPNDVLYKLHAFPFTLTTNADHVADDSGASYAGGDWPASYDQGGYYDDTVHDSNTAGASASYTFTGNAIAWVGGRDTNHGFASVSVDGGPPTLVDTYAAQQQKQQVLYADNNLSSGKHTITITVTSQKEAVSSGTFQDVDAFIVGGQGQSAPIAVSPKPPLEISSFAASPNTIKPGQQTTFQVVVRNQSESPLSGTLTINGPVGWTVAPASQDYSLAPGGQQTFSATTINPGITGQPLTFTASATNSNGTPGDHANTTVFTGHLRCLLGNTDQPVFHADPGYSCTLDQGYSYYDPNYTIWPRTAPANYCWCENPPLPLLFHVTVPAGVSGTLRLFLVDGDNYHGGRAETVYVDGQNLGTFSSFQQGKWATVDLTSAQTASGRINVEVDDAQQGSNVVVSEVDF